MPSSPISGIRNKWVFISCWLLLTIIYFFILRDFSFNTDSVLKDCMLSSVLLAGLCVLIMNNVKYYKPGTNRYMSLLVLCLVLAFLWVFAVKIGLSFMISSDPDYMTTFHRTYTLRIGVALILMGCIALISMLWYHGEDQKESDKKKKETESLAKDAELNSIRQQLQPHFLFNSLNSINALIGSQPDQARKMVNQLSQFLRGTLRKEDQQFVTLEEELNHLSLYLEIEKVRFGHRLNTEIICEEGTGEQRLPSLLLQPIVENAIKFGLYDTIGEVKITIHAANLSDGLQISVTNPFDPETSSPKSGTGFGLRSVERRLFLLFSLSNLLKTKVEDNLYTTIVKIPINDKSNTDR